MTEPQSPAAREIVEAADALDRKAVDALSRALVSRLQAEADVLPDGDALIILARLRRKRFFAQMQALADAMIQAGLDDLPVRRQYAQALIEQGALTAAGAVLRELGRDARRHPAERAEALGLLGRAFKQQYVNARQPGLRANQAALRAAVRSYAGAYGGDAANNYWHGINVAACVARGRRDGLRIAPDVDPRALAGQLLTSLPIPATAPEHAAPWVLATALEASIALEDGDRAAGLALLYAAHPEADAFEIGSTLRQLSEVWGLGSDAGIGAKVLPLLREGLLRRENGAFTVTPDEARTLPPGLEKVFGFDDYRSLEWYRTGLRRTRIVARIGVEQARGRGTGFLVHGTQLGERFGTGWLLLTNAHVVSSEPGHRPALRPSEAVVTFEALGEPGAAAATYKVRREVAVSAPDRLDFALLELDREVDGVEPGDAGAIAPELPRLDDRPRVYIVGHPGGGSLSFSIHDNLLLDHRDHLLHYRTPTEGGSSGSPVYDDQWRLIGLHHAGRREMPMLDGSGRVYEANEGITLRAIRAALSQVADA